MEDDIVEVGETTSGRTGCGHSERGAAAAGLPQKRVIVVLPSGALLSSAGPRSFTMDPRREAIWGPPIA